jgi:hypothetical protein
LDRSLTEQDYANYGTLWANYQARGEQVQAFELEEWGVAGAETVTGVAEE